MGAGRVFIHVCGTCHSIFLPDRNYTEKLQFLPHINFCEVFNVIPLLTLPDLEITLRRIEQISNLFHIDFKDRHLQLEFHVFWWFFNGSKQVFNLYKRILTILGIIPRLSFSERSYPCIVCVFPELVCP